MNPITLISTIILKSPAEESGEKVGETLFYVVLIVAIYLIMRRVRTKK